MFADTCFQKGLARFSQTPPLPCQRQVIYHVSFGKDSWVLPLYGSGKLRTLRLGSLDIQFQRLGPYLNESRIPTDEP